MPTGYTSDIYDGKSVSLGDFILTCAHAFVIEMRDRSLTDKIPLPVLDTSYHDDGLASDRAEMNKITAMSEAELDEIARVAYEEAMERYQEMEIGRVDLRSRYERMLAQVIGWREPTPEHQGLKDFMIEQLRISIDGDTRPSPFVPQQKTGAEYRAERIGVLQRGIEYHTDARQEKIERHEQNARWIEALYASLPGDGA